MICRKLLIYPAAKVFFILDQISGLLNCWEKRNKQHSRATVILERFPEGNRLLHLGERRGMKYFPVLWAPEELILMNLEIYLKCISLST